MEYCLEVDNLSKSYRKAKVLDCVNMRVPKGAIYGLIGNNGAGKTTLIKTICGLQDPTSGGFSLFGENNSVKGIFEARKRMGALIESPALYGMMSAKENLKYQYVLIGKPTFDGIDELLESVGLKDVGNKLVRHFSIGMRQRLGIAMAICGNPDFVVLDEPINGIDPQGIVEIRELILKLNTQRNVTFLISSHILDELAKIATHYGFMEKGRIIKESSAQDLKGICKKKLIFRVDKSRNLSVALDSANLKYKFTSINQGEIYTEIAISDLCDVLKAHDISLLEANVTQESLESYFINVLGGNDID